MILCAAIVTTLQPLAIRTHFRSVQTLTSLSDYATAWNGPGAALFTLFQNARLPAAPIPVLLTVAYFACITSLQTSTPLLFAFPAVNESSLVGMATTIGFPDFNATTDAASALASAGVIAGAVNASLIFNWYTASAATSLLDGSFNVDTPGVVDNVVYDTLVYDGVSAFNGSAAVNRTAFVVSCGQLPQDPVITSTPTSEGANLVNFVSAEDGGRFLNMTDSVQWVSGLDAASQVVSVFSGTLVTTDGLIPY
jgi:hypothetical protein